MKVAAVAALIAALLLGAVTLGRIGGGPGKSPVDKIELSSEDNGGRSSASPEPSEGPEHVKMNVSEHELDDHGGRGRGGDDESPAPTPTADDHPDNSGKGSQNSGSGSSNSGRDGVED